MAESKMVPGIRFAGFTDPWEQHKVGDYYDFKNGLNKGKEFFGSGTPIVNFTDVFHNRGLKPEQLKGKVKLEPSEIKNFNVQKGDLFFTRTSETIEEIGYPSVMLESPKDTVFSGFVLRGRCILSDDPLDDLFKKYVFFTDAFRAEMLKKSSMTTRALTSGTAIKNMQFSHPLSKEEQYKVGELITALDNLITFDQQKHNKLLALKKSMFEKMFPKAGKDVPEIRFAGFTAPWKLRKLGDIFEEYSEKNHEELPALTIIQGGGTVRRDESERSLQYDKDSLSNYKMVNKGDFIVHLRSFEGGLEKATTSGIISPAYHTFHGEGVDPRFYYLYFRSQKFIEQDLKPHVYGIRDGRSIDIEGMKTIDIPWTRFDEQQVIGGFIEQLDNLITLHQRKYEKLKQFKQSLLEKMFV